MKQTGIPEKNKQKGIKMKMFSVRLLSGIVILLTAVLGAAETPAPAKWSEDYLQVRKEAAAVKKPILLFFTGSDWPPYWQSNP